MAAYTELVQRVRDWSNRDVEVLSDELVGTFIQFAADECYRMLRVPALECTIEYTIDSENAGSFRLGVPADLTEFIQLRRRDPNSLTGYVVYDAKADIRSFYDEFTYKYSEFFWTREGNDLLLCPRFNAGEIYELYYYARQTAVSDTEVDSEGNLVRPNWLRDENQRILLFGALAEAFDYLDEQEQSQKYRAKFQAELRMLNDEEMKRKTLGGNVQVHFIAPLI